MREAAEDTEEKGSCELKGTSDSTAAAAAENTEGREGRGGGPGCARPLMSALLRFEGVEPVVALPECGAHAALLTLLVRLRKAVAKAAAAKAAAAKAARSCS